MIPTLSQTYPKMIPKLSQNGPKMVEQMSPEYQKVSQIIWPMGRPWAANGPPMGGPSERAARARGVKRDKIANVFLAKTRVGFGRTEVSARLDCIVVCALSSGHGPENP